MPSESRIADGDEQREAGDLGDGSDEGGGGGWCAFVGVGRPEMERHGGDFEAESGGDHDQSDGSNGEPPLLSGHVYAVDNLGKVG